MAKFANLKWCLAVVAVLLLFAFQRQKSATRNTVTPEPTIRIATEPGEGSALYTFAPPDRDVHTINQLHEPESVETKIPDSVAVNIPMIDHQDEIAESQRLEPEYVSGNSEQPDLLVTEVDLPEMLPAQVKQEDPVTPEFMPGDQLEDSVSENTPTDFVMPAGVRMNVEEHIEYGKSLARRGAVYGARQEFLAGLRLIAQAMDNQLNTQRYTENLFSALVAFNESDDFYFAQSENNGRVDVKTLARRHQSRILNDQQAASMTPMAAMQTYYQYVQKHLVDCSGHTVVAGEALYCIGKLFNLKAQNTGEGDGRLDNAKALVFHDAALECDPSNFKAANELGVLMAKTGRLEPAKQLFLRSLQISQLPKVWSNLAEVHRQLGEQDLAQLATAEYQRMLDAPPVQQNARIKWLPPEQFAADSRDQVELRTASRPQGESDLSPATQDNQEGSSFKKFMKRLF